MSIKILALESSCDETAAAIVEDGRTVLSDIVASQIETHALYGGVVPEIASRQHLKHICEVADMALKKAQLTASELDAVAVAYGPGLVGALLVSVSYAKGLAWACGKPLIGVDHMWGHICANMLHSTFEPPFICLVVSGGHTELVYIRDWLHAELLGMTNDDAAGEAFDKSARVLGLGYPGGAKLDALAEQGDPGKYSFPRALIRDSGFEFSFSGVKTSVMTHVSKYGCEDINDLCAGIREAITDVLCVKAVRACKGKGIMKLAIAGGVAANSGLRGKLRAMCEKEGIFLHIPDTHFCTDNAAMSGAAAYNRFIAKEYSSLSLNAVPYLDIC